MSSTQRTFSLPTLPPCCQKFFNFYHKHFGRKRLYIFIACFPCAVQPHLHHKVPVSSSPWLLSEEVLAAMSSGSLGSLISAPSSSCSRSLSDDRPPRAGALYSSRLQQQQPNQTKSDLCCVLSPNQQSS